jgi:hypothetical protein
MNSTTRDNSIAYTIGRLHGLRRLPQYPLFPADSWEGRQYKQGYIDGAVALDNDIERETKCLAK